MKELLRIAASLRADPSPAVLCTLVGIAGSSFRTIGARMLWRPEGSRIGGISGGCLEADLMSRAAGVLQTGRPCVANYNTAGEADIVWGSGSGCEGTVAVWIEPVAGMPAWLEFVLAAWDRRENVALFLECTHAHQSSGVLAALSSGGLCWHYPDYKDLYVLKHLLPHTIEQQTATPMLAHRDAGFFCEFLPPPPSLTLFGAGDDAQSLAVLATELGWRVTVVDSRAPLLTESRFPAAHARLPSPAESAISALPPFDERSLVVVMTHRYLDDLPILRALLPRPLAYLGLLGPKKRAEKILSELAAEGLAITPEMRARLHAPAGLDLGGGTPEEIALAILAEMQAVRSARDARPLRQRLLPIHRDQGHLEERVSTPPRFAAVILAAGASVRLGKPKQLLSFEGRSLLARTIDAARAAHALPIVVVIGAHEAAIREELTREAFGVFIVKNPHWAEGMGTSIAAGFAALKGHDASLGTILVAACDQPHLSAHAITRLQAALDGEKTIAATRHGDSAGVPAIFTHAHFSTLRVLRGAEGARSVIATHRATTAVVDLPELTFDIDTPEDWKKIHRLPPANNLSALGKR